MGVGAGLYMYDVVVESSRLLSDLLMSSCNTGVIGAMHRVPLQRWAPVRAQ